MITRQRRAWRRRWYQRCNDASNSTADLADVAEITSATSSGPVIQTNSWATDSRAYAVSRSEDL